MLNRSIFHYFLTLVLLSPITSAASDDAFMDAMNMELNKLDNDTTDSTTTKAADAPDKKEFESILEQEHRSSYHFYLKLQNHIQDEIYALYVDGASFVEIRKKILNRYLHR